MGGEFWLNVVMRWLHVAAAVLGVGTTLAMRFGVLPALATLPNGEEVLTAIRRPVKMLIHTAMGVLLLTGFYNYSVSMPAVRAKLDARVDPFRAYHPVIGFKILLALTLFTIAILLLKPVPTFHENRKTWLSVNVVLGLVILLLSAYLRRLWAL